ncbi:hypothetical protein [Streptomyces cacaoi]|uniref:hypothetical protein n=1 Tax=Streptomyces cacaoi TaxID=1898 RepID=UPI002609E5C8|nr:hypothetical protein [Streptomyces cacaoi]
MTTVEIIECTDPTELHRHYPRQPEAQGAYIELDLRRGTLCADYDYAVDNGAPPDVWHGFDRHYRIPVLTADAANRVMREIAPLADRILADWEERWNGQNHVAVLGADAEAAEEEIHGHLGLSGYPEYGGEPHQGFSDRDLVAQWPVDGAVTGHEAADYGITAETTSERLDEIEAEITRALAELSPSGVAVVSGLREYLRGLTEE